MPQSSLELFLSYCLLTLTVAERLAIGAVAAAVAQDSGLSSDYVRLDVRRLFTIDNLKLHDDMHLFNLSNKDCADAQNHC